MNKRDKLVKELEDKFRILKNIAEWDLSEEPDFWGGLADFIIADRKRIVEPLVDLKLCNGGTSYEYLCQGIEQTLKNAGV